MGKRNRRANKTNRDQFDFFWSDNEDVDFDGCCDCAECRAQRKQWGPQPGGMPDPFPGTQGVATGIGDLLRRPLFVLRMLLQTIFPSKGDKRNRESPSGPDWFGEGPSGDDYYYRAPPGGSGQGPNGSNSEGGKSEEPQKQDPFIILGLSANGEGESDESVNKAYKGLALQWHPDKNNASEESEFMMKRINEAKARALKQLHQRSAPKPEEYEEEEEEEEDDWLWDEAERPGGRSSNSKSSGKARGKKAKAKREKERKQYRAKEREAEEQIRAQEYKEEQKRRAEERKRVAESQRQYAEELARVRKLQQEDGRHSMNTRSWAKETEEKMKQAQTQDLGINGLGSNPDSKPAQAPESEKPTRFKATHPAWLMDENKDQICCAMKIGAERVLLRQLYSRAPTSSLDIKGNTSLHYSAYYRNVKYANMVIQTSNAMWWKVVLAKNNDHKTALDIAREQEADDAVLERFEQLHEGALKIEKRVQEDKRTTIDFDALKAVVGSFVWPCIIVRYALGYLMTEWSATFCWQIAIGCGFSYMLGSAPSIAEKKITEEKMKQTPFFQMLNAILKARGEGAFPGPGGGF